MDLLIKALEHESLLSRLMFTPLDVHLLRECPVPLHFVSQVRHALQRMGGVTRSNRLTCQADDKSPGTMTLPGRSAA